jgi:tetratricopeptide (TPR) repeat protein
MDDCQFTDDLIALRDFAFVTWKKDSPHVFNMHALVQFATRCSLEPDRAGLGPDSAGLEPDSAELDRVHALSIRKLYLAFPNVKFDQWAECRSFYPHVTAGMNRPPKDDETLEKWTSILASAALLDFNMGRAQEGTILNNKALKMREQLFGLDDRRTLESLDLAAKLLSLEGRWSEAERILEQVVQNYRDTLGTKYRDTITCMTELAAMYLRRRKFDQAERLLMEVGPLCRKKEDLCEVCDCLSGVYAATGRQKEGLELLQQRNYQRCGTACDFKSHEQSRCRTLRSRSGSRSS